MLETLTSINQSVANILLHGLSPLLVSKLPCDSIASQIKMFGDCDVLSELPLYMQAYFLKSKTGYAICQEMELNKNIIHNLCAYDVDIGDSKRLQYLLSRDVNTVMLCAALKRESVYDNISAVKRNIALYNAPISHGCVHLNVWRQISWDEEGLRILEHNAHIQKLAQFLCEHISVELDSYSVYCVTDPERVLSALVRMWFTCGKDMAVFSDMVHRYSELFLLEYVCEDDPIKYLAEKFSWSMRFIDCIDIRKLPCDMRKLVVFALLNNKAAFLRFLLRKPELLETLSESIITEKWFREYMDIDDVSESNYEQLTELPAKNIYKVSAPISVDTFLTQVY